MIAAPATKWSQSASSVLQQVDVLGVAARRPGSAGGPRSCARRGPYLEKLSSPTTSWPGGEQLLDEVAGDEAGRAGDQDLHRRADGSLSAVGQFQTSTTGLSAGGSQLAVLAVRGRRRTGRPTRASTSSSGTKAGRRCRGRCRAPRAPRSSSSLRACSESDSRGSSLSALNAMPRMPTVVVAAGRAAFGRLDEEARQPLVDQHRRVAEDEVVVADRGELHRVLEQAGAGGEARARACRAIRG